MSTRRGMSLIEVLIVVAAIALLAAVVLPNYLEAQTRSKLGQAKNDLRVIERGLRAYEADQGAYPFDGYFQGGLPTGYNYWYLPRDLSTPVAYLENIAFADPFRSGPASSWQFNHYRYFNTHSTWGTSFSSLSGKAGGASIHYGAVLLEVGDWRLLSVGPDGTYGPTGWQGISDYPAASWPLPYDATNGAVSTGDIIRTDHSPTGYLNGPS